MTTIIENYFRFVFVNDMAVDTQAAEKFAADIRYFRLSVIKKIGRRKVKIESSI